MVTLDFGPYSANSVSFHPAGKKKRFWWLEKTKIAFQGQLLTAASSDRTIKLYNIASEQVMNRYSFFRILYYFIFYS
jgi:WD40 repeat protein